MFHLNKTLRRLITQSDLDRYLFYGKKMRKLHFTYHDKNDPSRVDSSVFRAVPIFLDLFYPGRIAMPNLREFNCLSDNFDSIWDIIPYLSPNLRQIDLDTRYPNTSLPTLALLSTLSSKWPFIKRLRLRGYPNSSTSNALKPSTFPCGFLHLSTFNCPDFTISHNAIGHLARLPNLCNLSLYFSSTGDASGLSTLTTPPRPFPSLQELELNGTFFESGIKFIQTCLCQCH
jgi:hypothetical protein